MALHLASILDPWRLLSFPVAAPETPSRIPAGAPPANSTFFCDAEGVTCYSRSTAMLNYTSAATFCALRAGKLLHPTTGAKQLAVESYFRVSSWPGWRVARTTGCRQCGR
jgi:hypothetical protein